MRSKFNENRLRSPSLFCDICNQEEGIIRASGIAPVSYSSCNRCTIKNAENLNVLMTYIVLNGINRTNCDSLTEITSFKDGKYIDWSQIYSFFEMNKTEITRDVIDDFYGSDEEQEVSLK